MNELEAGGDGKSYEKAPCHNNDDDLRGYLVELLVELDGYSSGPFRHLQTDKCNCQGEDVGDLGCRCLPDVLVVSTLAGPAIHVRPVARCG